MTGHPLRRCFAALLLCFVMSVASLAHADDYALSYSGRLVDPTGKSHEGPVALRFRFFHQDVGGSAVLELTAPFSDVALKDGVFQVSLPFDESQMQTVFPGVAQGVWIEVT